MLVYSLWKGMVIKMFDTHIHTKPFSLDSEMELQEVMEKQRETGICVVLTEHMDFDLPSPDTYWFDPALYFETYGPFRSEKLLLGVEIGLQILVADKNQKLIESNPFDMVIAAIHAAKGKDLYDLSYYKMFPDKKSSFMMYLETMYENIRCFDNFDTLAHIDYVSRKAPYSDPFLHYEEFSEIMDKILLLLAEKEKSLEINTRLFDRKEAVDSLRVICKNFYRLGGRTVTIGSDAHKKDKIEMFVKQAYKMADECGLTPVYYKERKPYPVNNI